MHVYPPFVDAGVESDQVFGYIVSGRVRIEAAVDVVALADE